MLPSHNMYVSRHLVITWFISYCLLFYMWLLEDFVRSHPCVGGIISRLYRRTSVFRTLLIQKLHIPFLNTTWNSREDATLHNALAAKCPLNCASKYNIILGFITLEYMKSLYYSSDLSHSLILYCCWRWRIPASDNISDIHWMSSCGMVSKKWKRFFKTLNYIT